MSFSEILRPLSNGSGAAFFRAAMLAAMLAVAGVLWDVRDMVQEIRSDTRLLEHRLNVAEQRIDWYRDQGVE